MKKALLAALLFSLPAEASAENWGRLDPVPTLAPAVRLQGGSNPMDWLQVYSYADMDFQTAPFSISTVYVEGSARQALFRLGKVGAAAEYLGTAEWQYTKLGIEQLAQPLHGLSTVVKFFPLSTPLPGAEVRVDAVQKVTERVKATLRTEYTPHSLSMQAGGGIYIYTQAHATIQAERDNFSHLNAWLNLYVGF